MNKYFIYLLLKDNIPFYIGVTTDIEIRVSSHKLKFGVDITFEIKEEYFGTKSAAYTLEDFWIKKYSDLGIHLLNKHSDKDAVTSKCDYCHKDIFQPQGKKKKRFCNNTCRSNYWYGQNKKGKVQVTDLTKPNKVVKPLGTKKPKTNFTINTTPKEIEPKKGTMAYFLKYGE